MIARLVVAATAAVIAVAGAVVLFGLACVVLRPFPDEHDETED